MPFYEYRCEGCEARFQTFDKTMNSPPPRCPKCQGTKVKRLPSVFGVGAAAPESAGPSRCGSCRQSGSCPMAQ